jgi:hypothetical protein
MKLFKFLRPLSPVNNTILQTTLRGPKKKAEKKDYVKSEHILNFYKNADDVSILPDEYYPKWVMEMDRYPPNLSETFDMFLCGMSIPSAQDFPTIYKSYRRQLMKQTNYSIAEKYPWESRIDLEKEPDEELDLLDYELAGLEEEMDEGEEGEGGAEEKK